MKDVFGMWSILTQSGSQLLVLAIIIPVAILVFLLGSRAWRRERGADALRPRGRARFDGVVGTRSDRRSRDQLERLREARATPIGSAQTGWVRFEGIIESAGSTFAGECVWRNRVGAPRAAAIAAEIVIIKDATGRCGVEHLDAADVRAHVRAADRHRQVSSLQVGDRVEVCGWFEREGDTAANAPDLVYGTVGGRHELLVALIERPRPSNAPPGLEPSNTPPGLKAAPPSASHAPFPSPSASPEDS